MVTKFCIWCIFAFINGTLVQLFLPETLGQPVLETVSEAPGLNGTTQIIVEPEEETKKETLLLTYLFGCYKCQKQFQSYPFLKSFITV